MSSDERSRKAEVDLEVVRVEALDRAKLALETAGAFRPFAITLSGQSDLLSHEVASDAVEGHSTAFEILSYGVRAGMGGTLPLAVALARQVVLRDASSGGTTSAVCVALEHLEGLARHCFLPYRREGETLIWLEPRSTPAVPWFFGVAGEPQVR